MQNSNANPLFVSGEPNEKVSAFIDWLVTPPDMRVPATQADFGRENGVSASQLRDWKADERVKRLVSQRADTLNMSPDRVQEVMDALHRRAKTGDPQAAKLYMDQVARIESLKRESVSGYEEMTDEELDALADERLKGRNEQALHL